MTDQDIQLAKLAAQKNEQAFIALYRKYFSPIYRFCYWQTNNRHDAEDLTQNVFIEMAKSVGKFKGEGSFKNWLYTIAKRQVNAWIKRKYQLPQEPLFENSIPDTENWIDHENEKLKIKTGV